MTITKSQDKTDHLEVLGKGGQTKYQLDGPHSGILETFPNNYPNRPYIVSVEFPEYTSLCPMTGQPDFGVIVMEYIPKDRIVESKSLKLYFFAYRNHQSFMETIANTMLEDFVEALDPLWCRVKGLFSPRGATTLHVFAEHFDTSAENLDEIKSIVSEWKQEANRHSS